MPVFDTLKKKVVAILAALGLVGAGVVITLNSDGCLDVKTQLPTPDAGEGEGELSGE